MTRTPIAAALAALLLSGCVALGWRFGPGFSLTATPLGETLFSAPPVVEHRGEEYFLTWTQGTYQYFFQPDYKGMDGRLVFALVATSSSGNQAGRHQEMKIKGADHILALQHGGAYWWEAEPEPDGKFVPLRIVE